MTPLIWSLALVVAGQMPPPRSDLLDAIPSAYEANRASLQTGKISFRYSVGTAASLRSAMDGTWTRRFDSEGLYAFAGNRGIYTSVASPEVMRAARHRTGEGHWTSQVDSTRVITDGKITFWDQLSLSDDGERTFHQAQIDEGVDKFYQNATIPLNLGNPGAMHYQLRKDIERSKLHRPDWVLSRVEQTSAGGGGEVVELAFEFPNGRCEYRVDIEHGAIPRQYRVENRKVKSTMIMVLDDIRYVANRAWYPFRQVVYFEDDHATKELTITEADFANVPGDATFKLEFPEPIGVINSAARPMVKYPPRRVWDLQTLPSPGAAGTRRIITSRPSDPTPAMPGERERNFGSSVPWIAGAALALTVIGIRLGRRLQN